MTLTSDILCPKCDQALLRLASAPLGRFAGTHCEYILTCTKCDYTEPLTDGEIKKAIGRELCR